MCIRIVTEYIYAHVCLKYSVSDLIYSNEEFKCQLVFSKKPVMEEAEPSSDRSWEALKYGGFIQSIPQQ